MTSAISYDVGETDCANARILILGDIEFSGVRLSRILDEADCVPIVFAPDTPPGELIPEDGEPPNLLILRLDGSGPETLTTIREFRTSRRASAIPILGVMTFDRIGLDLQVLRSHGVVSVVDDRLEPADVLRRIGQIVRPVGRRRVCERVDCFFPVDVERGGVVSSEFALNLSATGMRLTSVESLETNTDMHLQFRLPMVADAAIEARARLVRQAPLQGSCGRFEIGVFFYPLQSAHPTIIEAEVARLLAG